MKFGAETKKHNKEIPGFTHYSAAGKAVTDYLLLNFLNVWYISSNSVNKTERQIFKKC